MQGKVGIGFLIVAFVAVIMAGMARATGEPFILLCLLIGAAVCLIVGTGLWSAYWVNKIKQMEKNMEELKKEVKKLKGE